MSDQQAAKRAYVASLLEPLEWDLAIEEPGFKRWEAPATTDLTITWYADEGYYVDGCHPWDTFSEATDGAWEVWIDLHMDRIKYPPEDSSAMCGLCQMPDEEWADEEWAEAPSPLLSGEEE